MSSTALREDISSTQSQLGFDAVTWQCSTICDGEDGDEHHVRPKQGVVTKKAPPQGGVEDRRLLSDKHTSEPYKPLVAYQ